MVGAKLYQRFADDLGQSGIICPVDPPDVDSGIHFSAFHLK
jgi:hypothetical protein